MGATIALWLIGFSLLAAGALIGRYYVPGDRALGRTARHARLYMRAVNALLARDQDGAIEQLREVVRENVSDVEPYFALAALFRRRGEWERAVRVHQSIELRPDAGNETRLRALYELGLDFRAAGMPRRATRAMEQCLELEGKHEGAIRALCGLYEEQGRFADAAVAWTRLDKLRGGERSSRVAHLWAAAASTAIAERQLDQAETWLRRVERRDGEPSHEHAHVLVVSAELAAAKGDPVSASRRLVRSLRAAPALAAHVVVAIERAERQQVLAEAGDPAGADARADELARLVAARTGRILDDVLADLGPQPDLQLARARVLAATDVQGALVEVRALLEHAPSDLSLRLTAARLVLALGDPDAAQHELAALVAKGGPLARLNRGLWMCSDCGHLDPAFAWRCPGCRQWGTAIYDTDRTRLAPPRPPRERRATPRALTGVPTRALPAPPDDAPRGPSADPGGLTRAGAWISAAWHGMRGRSRRPPPTNEPRPSRE